MCHSLSHSDEHQTSLIFVIVSGQLTKHSDQTSIVSTGSNQTHGKNGVVCSVRIGIVAEFAQCFQNIQLRVGNATQSQCKWNSATNNRFAVTNLKIFELNCKTLKPIYQVSKHTHCHLAANIFAHCNQSNTQNGNCLLGRQIWTLVLFRRFFLVFAILKN